MPVPEKQNEKKQQQQQRKGSILNEGKRTHKTC